MISFKSIDYVVARQREKAERAAAHEAERAERRGAAEAYRRTGLMPVQIAAAMAEQFPGEQFNADVVRISIRRARGR